MDLLDIKWIYWILNGFIGYEFELDLMDIQWDSMRIHGMTFGTCPLVILLMDNHRFLMGKSGKSSNQMGHFP